MIDIATEEIRREVIPLLATGMNLNPWHSMPVAVKFKNASNELNDFVAKRDDSLTTAEIGEIVATEFALYNKSNASVTMVSRVAVEALHVITKPDLDADDLITVAVKLEVMADAANSIAERIEY